MIDRGEKYTFNIILSIAFMIFFILFLKMWQKCGIQNI